MSVDSYRYDDRAALLAALREGLIAQGAIVWAAVSDEAVDTDVAFESLAEKVPVERLQHGIVGDVACAAASPGNESRRWRGVGWRRGTPRAKVTHTQVRDGIGWSLRVPVDARLTETVRIT